LHASRRIQYYLANGIQSKFCPVLHFKYDENFKKTIETLGLIERVARDFNPPPDDMDELDELDELTRL
jgi:ribosome-binding factor A